jgi:hypothetical protein
MKRRALFLAIVSLLSVPCLAIRPQFPLSWYVPFDRLIANTEAFIKDHPNDAQGYYTLARMHYFTFVNRLELIPTMDPDGFPPDNVAPDWQVSDLLLSKVRYDYAQQLVLGAWGYATASDIPKERQSAFPQAVWDKERELEKQGWKPDYLETDKVLAHAAAAVDNFERALDLDPNNGLFYLGLASLYDDYSFYAADANITSLPQQLACVTVPRIRVTYYLAYRFSIEQERLGPKSGHLWTPLQLVSYEAGSAYLRWAQKEPVIADSNALAEVRTDVAKLERLPVAITPIILSTRDHTSVLDLLDPNTHVTFDLDGTGRNLEWPWLKPSTGLLVWDPQNKGEITSGRQLFGTATWWLLFPTGYAALDALDDSRDGSLSGAELRGIGVWFDRNANGRSDPGEVQPVTDFGMQAIRTRSTGSDHGMPMNAQGLVLKSGKVVPTYDWLVSPASWNP